MIIKQSTIECVESLTPIVNEYRAIYEPSAHESDTKTFLEKLVKHGDAVTFMALNDESNMRVIGFANLYPSYSTLALKRLWILNDLFVSEEFRGKGVAKALIERAIAFASQTDAVRIELKTGRGNEVARRLYQSVGFTIDEGHVYYRVPVPDNKDTSNESVT